MDLFLRVFIVFINLGQKRFFSIFFPRERNAALQTKNLKKEVSTTKLTQANLFTCLTILYC